MLQRLACEEEGELLVVIEVGGEPVDRSNAVRELTLVGPLPQEPLTDLLVEEELRSEDDDETTLRARSILDDGNNDLLVEIFLAVALVGLHPSH